MIKQRLYGEHTVSEIKAICEQACVNEFRHSNGVICGGSIRIARADFDTDPTEKVKEEIFELLCIGATAAGAMATRIQLLEALLSDIKAWDVDQLISIPLELRQRIQAAIGQDQ